ncbi:MAG: hypothetical protein ACD_59C00074G0002 [uncultured bacterium]|nr:MAG: hypothetical protein ACD_59C00074G0002 [uncultured bacterium]
MSNQPWYNALIEKLLAIYSEKIIINDQDHIIKYLEVKAALSNQFAYFEYTHEVELRKFVAENSSKQIIIIVKSPSTYIPYDIISGSERIAWNLNDIFRGLDKKVLKDFEKHYQLIYENLTTRKLGLINYGNEETLQVLLFWIYGIDLAGIKKTSDIADLLIKLYEDFEKLPESIEIIASKFQGIPLEIFENKGLFHKWLTQNKIEVKDTEKIEKVDLNAITIECQKNADRILEIINSDKTNWLELAANWAKINYLRDKYCIDSIDFNSIESQIGKNFKKYIENEYAGLFFSGYTKTPATIDRVLHFITCRPISKIALICIDCMGIYEWNAISNYLLDKLKCQFKFNAVQAIIPTITSYSRQSLFSGLKPSEFKGFSEEKAFREHLKNNWLKNTDEIDKVKLFINANVNNYRNWQAYDYIGLVFNFLDDMIHSITFKGQNKGLVIKNLENILTELKFENIISGLLEKNYKVYLSSDHGSVICHGNGFNADKYLVDSKAKRALIYSDYSLAKEFALKAKANLFTNEDILGSKIVVIPENREMFGNINDLIISHGGTHIEEVILPFVEVIN